jgi:hypothetical protein
VLQVAVVRVPDFGQQKPMAAALTVGVQLKPCGQPDSVVVSQLCEQAISLPLVAQKPLMHPFPDVHRSPKVPTQLSTMTGSQTP